MSYFETQTPYLYDVVGIGNALVDIVIPVSDDFLEAHRITKDQGALVDGTQFSYLLDDARRQSLVAAEDLPKPLAAGSVANTMIALSILKGRGAFIGRVSEDALGQSFLSDCFASGVRLPLPPVSSSLSTGGCLVCVTPDGKRSMLAHLGAAATMTPQDLDPLTVTNSRFILLEGYVWEATHGPDIFSTAAQMAQAHGRHICLTLADVALVRRHAQEFLNFVQTYHVKIICNAAEAMAFTQTSTEASAIAAFQDMGLLAIVTQDARGATIVGASAPIQIAAPVVDRVVDSTGAGDVFAAGFLAGICKGFSLEQSGILAAQTAGKVLGHYGARLSE